MAHRSLMNPAAPRGALPGEGACAPGFWSRIRTRDSRCTRSVLYPSELSKEVTCRIRTGGRWHPKPLLYPTELTSSRNTDRAGPAYAAGIAARTGRGLQPVPLEPVVATLRMAGCRQPVIRVGAKRPNLLMPADHPPARAEASRHSALAPLAVAPASAGARPDASGRKSPSGGRWPHHLSVHEPVLANAENKTPPGGEPEGVRVASGDRGDRSPRKLEISRCG